MAITQRDLNVIDENGIESYHLRTTVDCSDAIAAAKAASEAGGRVGKGSDEVVVIAQIPDELYALDPMLKKAMFFRSIGDNAQAVHWTREFLRLNPAFKVTVSKKFYQGCGFA